MSYLEFSDRGNIHVITIVLKFEDTSYSLTEGVSVPESRENTIDIETKKGKLLFSFFTKSYLILIFYFSIFLLRKPLGVSPTFL